jgi:hypothetical protein
MTDNQLRLLVALLGCETCVWVKPNRELRQFMFEVPPRYQKHVEARARCLCLYQLFCVQVLSRHCIVKDKNHKTGLRFRCANCTCIMFQDTSSGNDQMTIRNSNVHSSTECAFHSAPSVSDDSLFGNDCRDMVGGAFLPALLGAVFIIKFPAEYNKSVFIPEAPMVCSMRDILQDEYGLSLAIGRIHEGLLQFLTLISPASRDSGNFRNDLKAATGVNVNACAEMIFLKLALVKSAQQSECAGAKAKVNPSNPSSNAKRKAVAVDGSLLPLIDVAEE